MSPRTRRDAAPLRPREALLHPLFWAALALLLVNDHVLKGADVLHPLFTGKLSDFAGLVVAPMVLAVLARAQTMRSVWACHIAVGLGFAAINLSGDAARAVEALTAILGIGWRVWVDPTDLVALPALGLSVHVLGGAARRVSGRGGAWRRATIALGLAAGVCATTATSIARAPQPTTADGRVFAQGWYADPLFALDIESGRAIAQLEITTTVDSPVVRDGILYTGDDGEVAAFELATARQVWGRPRPEDGYRMQPLAADEQHVYVHFLPSTSLGGLDWEDRKLEALDRATGRSLWQVPAIGGARPPLLVGDYLLVTSGEELSAVATRDGRTLWTFAAPMAIGLPVAGPKHVYIGDADGTLYALDASTGQELWRDRLGDDESFMDRYYANEPRLALIEETLYYIVDHRLIALDPMTRQPRWSADDVDGVVVAEGVAFARTTDGWFTAFDAASGRKLWRVQIHDMVLGKPVIHRGVVCIRPQASVVYAFDLRTGKARWTFNLEEGTRMTQSEGALLLH